MDWINSAVVEKKLRGEASGVAAALGHKMSSWVAHPSEKRLLISRCEVCAESMTVAVRKLGAMPISGVAVQLHCRRISK